MQRIVPVRSRRGKRIAKRIPDLRLPSFAEETKPTRVGPRVQPMSPPRASRANIAVPPRERTDDAVLNVPGHIMPTANPHTASEAMLTMGRGMTVMPMYEAVARAQLNIINLSREILSPYLP